MSSRSSLSIDRLERRRKIERDSQRASRSRTKNRIDELENKIESLLVGQGDGRLNLLTRQLDEQKAENKRLQASLMSIQKILNAASDLDGIGSDSEQGGGNDKTTKVSASTTSLLVTQLATHDNHLIPLGEALSCRKDQEPTWKIVNNAITVAIKIMREDTVASTWTDADLSARAIMEGWTDVERVHNLDAGWQLLRQVDQHVFFPCGPVTRLAILRSMRLKLLQETKCSSDQDQFVPTYLLSEPVLELSDRRPILVDFFPWPQLRDHIVLQPSKYLPNEFAEQFSKNTHFLWSGSLQDVATLNVATGMHEFSSSFNDNFLNIHCWTLCFDFFVKFPELIGVIPIYNPLPRSIGFTPMTTSEANAVDFEQDLGVCDWPFNDSRFLDPGWMS